jgi:hypothetical protein
MPEESDGHQIGVGKNFQPIVPPGQFVRNSVVCHLQNSIEVTTHRLKNC